MSLLQNSNAISAGGYDINNSLRFRRSATGYLSRTPASASNRTTWTWSGWVKRGALGLSEPIFSSTATNNDNGWFTIKFQTTDTIGVEIYSGNVLITTQVFRDPSAWYHIVLAVDTTQATAANRLKLYVNGLQVTSFSTASYPAQNFNYSINSAQSHVIGSFQPYASDNFDGYMTEINFIDGQALTPSSFGATDAITGVWAPAAYTGTYGTNGFYLPFTQNTNSAYAVYTTDAASNYHSLPTGSQGTNFTFSGDFTIEGWVLYSSAVGDQSFYVSNSGSAYLALNIEMSTGNYNIYLNSSTPSGTFASGITVGNWTHVAMVRSGSTITLYTNGVAKGTITNSSTLGYSTLTLNRFGGGVSGARFLSNVRITKSAVYTANFVPPTTALTNIANTVVLTYQNATAIDNSSNGYTLTATGSPSMLGGNVIWNANIISDASGNKNHWTPNNLNYSFYGTTYDAMTDSPTLTSATVANYCTMNPLESFTNPVPQQANLYIPGTEYSQVKGTMWVSTGKWYFEWVSVGGSLPPYVGISNASITSWSNVTTSGISWYGHTDSYYKNFTATSLVTTSAMSIGDIIGVAFDCDAGTVRYYKNNTLVHTDTTLTPNQLVAPTLISTFSGGSWSSAPFNFGQRPFAYTPPTGYKALNTYNLPDSTIKKGNLYMDASLWTGNGATNRTITNTAGFKPDLVWTKGRSTTWENFLQDSTRGATNFLISNSTGAEGTTSPAIVSSFASNGFVIQNNGNSNNNGDTYVGWQWKANGGTTSSNTNGSITSTVQANATAGFSIATFTGASTQGATFGHGLGVAPKMVIAKSKTGATQHWWVYHASLGYTNNILLSSSGAAFADGYTWLATPSSTLVTVGDNFASSSTYVAYCWAEIAGFSKFGSYTGNGSADGPFVYLGFRPKYVLIKGSSSGGLNYDWYILDSSRDTYNLTTNFLCADLSQAEATGVNEDLLSNGFKIRGTTTGTNTNAVTYIYAAFAENPFKNSNAR